MFEDWKEHPKEQVDPTLLWEYDLKSEEWDWNVMAPRVVERVIERGQERDYYAILQLYGGFGNVREIVKQIRHLSPCDENWAAFVFHLKREEMLCYKRRQFRKEHFGGHFPPFS